MRHRKVRAKHFLLLAGFYGFGMGAVNAYGASTTASQELLSQAYRLTLRGDRIGAAAVYQQLMACCPEVGYPAYARYLNRTQQTTVTEALFNADATFAAQPALIRARTLISADRKAEGIEVLRTAEAGSGTLYTRTLLLVNQLRIIGEKDAATKELEKAVLADGLTDIDRKDLYDRLVQQGDSTSIARVLPGIIDHLVTSSTLDIKSVRAMAMSGLTAVSMGPEYAAFHDNLHKQATGSASAGWLYVLSSLKKGDTDSALSTLEAISSGSLTNRQQVALLEEQVLMAGPDSGRAISLYEKIIALSGDSTRLRLNLAQQYFRSKNFMKTAELLKPLDFDKLEAGDQQLALNLYLTSIGSAGLMADVVKEFLRLSKDLPYQKVREIASAPFVFFSPDNTASLRKAVDSQATPTSATANIYLLKMSLENQDNNPDGVVQALEKYTEICPLDADAAMELAEVRAAQAWQLIEANPQSSPTQELMQTTADSASRALWNVVRLRPYTPEPYNKLIALYNLYEQPEKARQVPLFLSDRPNATAEEVHLAAYIYATQGHPELSIPLYERALKMQMDTRYRLNYAAALGRVGRYDDAMVIYKDLVQNGVNGRQYHIHEVHGTALALAQKHNRQAEYLQFLEKLRTNPDVPDRKTFLLGEGRVLASAQLPDEALKFFNTYKAEFPEESALITDLIVSTYTEMKKFEEARQLLNQEISQTTDSENLAFLRNNLALSYRLEGNIEKAVAEWEKLAGDMPREQTAARALINAARALAQSGRMQQSQEFYQKFIKLNSGDVTGEQIARDELVRLDRNEVSTEMLVQSAMLEYGSDDHDHESHIDTGK